MEIFDEELDRDFFTDVYFLKQNLWYINIVIFRRDLQARFEISTAEIRNVTILVCSHKPQRVK